MNPTDQEVDEWMILFITDLKEAVSYGGKRAWVAEQRLRAIAATPNDKRRENARKHMATNPQAYPFNY